MASTSVVPLLSGCGGAERPVDASPIVAPDSEAGRRAITETETLLRLRQKQEAAARRRGAVSPEI